MLNEYERREFLRKAKLVKQYRGLATQLILRLVVSILLFDLPASAVAEDDFSQKAVIQFQQHVAPLLAEHCFECHSHEGKRAKNGLMLDSRDSLLKGGDSGPAIVPGEPDKSLLMQAVLHEGPEMPPDKKLSKDDIQALRNWIELGAYAPRGYTETQPPKANGELPWSFYPVRNPKPSFPRTDWVRNDIDRFVLEELDNAALNPVGDAAPETLLRRLYFDLIGLPPTLEQQRVFEARADNNLRAAMRSIVDALLDSPQFGERWGRHWLDTARYAESNGNNRNRVFRYAWRYRDWVIDALNRDMPYDQFLAEQVAGDLLDSKSDEQRRRMRIATGFLALGPKPYYPTIVPFDPDEPDRARYDWAAEQVDATMSATMALTVGCARCHDHKFDPISMTDYYALAGIFRSTEARFGMFYHLFGIAEGQAQRDFLYDWNLLVLNDELLATIKPLQEAYYRLAKEENTLRRQLDHLPRQIADLQATRENKRGKKPPRIVELQARLASARQRLPVVEREKARLKREFSYRVDQAMGVEDAAIPAVCDFESTANIIERGNWSLVVFFRRSRSMGPRKKSTVSRVAARNLRHGLHSQAL